MSVRKIIKVPENKIVSGKSGKNVKSVAIKDIQQEITASIKKSLTTGKNPKQKFYEQLLDEKNPNLREYYKMSINVEMFFERLKIMKEKKMFVDEKKVVEIINYFNKMNSHFNNKFMKIYNNKQNIPKEALEYFKKVNEIVVFSQKVERIEDLEKKIKTTFEQISHLEIFQEKKGK